MNDAAICPTERDGNDEVARQWSAGSMSPEDAKAFESHLGTCERCQLAVRRAARFTAALRTAAKDYRVKHDRSVMLRWAAVVALAAAAATVAFVRS